MRTDIYKVAEIGKGFLAIMSKPIVNEWVEEWYASIVTYGVKRFVSLLEPDEASVLGLSNEQQLCEENNIDFISLPIPASMVSVPVPHTICLLNSLFADIKAGVNTVIHCDTGIGRTGVIAASLLVKQGLSPNDAFNKIAYVRGVEVPETQEQYAWLFDMQSFIDPEVPNNAHPLRSVTP